MLASTWRSATRMPFAYSPLLDPRNAANFVGYADSVAGTLDLGLTNAACPGETSGSMISGTPPDNGCHEFYPVPLPRHVLYSGSQLVFAVQFLESHRHVHLVTLQIGGNDVLILLRSCGGNVGCVLAGLPGVETQMAAHLATIYAAIRGEAHYRHAIVVVPYFAFNYNDPSSTAITASLDGVVATVGRQFHARVADVFDAFAAASAPFGGIPCAAGLQVRISPTSCDIHPSAAGHALIARTVLAALGEEGLDD